MARILKWSSSRSYTNQLKHVLMACSYFILQPALYNGESMSPKRQLFLQPGDVQLGMDYFISMFSRLDVRFSASFRVLEEKSSLHQTLYLVWFFKRVLMLHKVVNWIKFSQIPVAQLNDYSSFNGKRVINWGGAYLFKFPTPCQICATSAVTLSRCFKGSIVCFKIRIHLNLTTFSPKFSKLI